MNALAQRAIIACAAGLLFAFLAFVSGADRYSRYQPTAVRFVPDVFRSNAALSEASTALLRGRNEVALRHANDAIAASPLDATGLAIRGAALSQLNRADEARETFVVAPQLGRREPLAAIYWFAEHLRQGEADMAATYLDALLRSQADFAPAQRYLSLLEQTPPGRTALSRRLARSARWTDAYLSASDMDTATLRSRAAFLSDPVGQPAALDCERIMPMIRELAGRGFRGEAEALQAGQCPKLAPPGLIADPEFEQFAAADESPFGWHRHATGDVRVSRLGGDHARIELENRSSVTRLVLSQPVTTGAGPIKVRVKVDGPGGQRLSASLDCGEPTRPALRRARIDQAGWQLSAAGCEDAAFGLWLRPGSGRVVIDRIEATAP